LLFCVWALTSCHSPANKGNGQGVPKKDTVKTIAQAPPQKKATGAFVILDTVAGKDTLKVVLFRDSMIRCSINNLADTFNAARDYMHWDTSFSDYLSYNVAPILIPGEKKPKKFILNDSLVVIPLCVGNSNMQLYLLNKTKKSLKFALKNGFNVFYSSSFYSYVDLKHNTIINYADRIYIARGPGEDHWVFPVFRYKIAHKHIVEINSSAVYFKEFERLDMENTDDIRTFFNNIVHHFNWKIPANYVPY